MALATTFRNFGHAIASGAKYFVDVLKDIVSVSQKAAAVAPQVEMIVGAIAGQKAKDISDIAFHVLGDVASALEKVGSNADSALLAKGINVTLDVATINAVKDAVGLIKTLLQGKGTPPPPAA